ncbi:hypothetical protein [Planococcus faecalis]|uniref:hypothetical protein n=1 Tax=Planococcus faecalis TaxID=1598147 RepID=UPI00210CB97C|nr:hypothetical protein [Planococcus faecalis]
MKKPCSLMKPIAYSLLFIFIVLPFVPLLLSSVSFGWQWPAIVPESVNLRAWNMWLMGILVLGKRSALV